MKPVNANTNRRNFLLGATLGTVGVVAGTAALVTGSPVDKIVPGAVPGTDTASGYRMTAHIQQYYDTTKL